MFQRIFLLAFFAVLLSGHVQAQLPEQAEDVAPLLIGESLPNISLGSVDGTSVALHDLLAEKPTVLIVYRGGWCPYCNRHLAEVGQQEAAILAKGYQIIAVAPDAIESLQATGEKVELNYQLLSDADGAFAKAAGIAFQAPERYGDLLKKSSGGANTGFLPVPAVFVLGQDATILFEYISPNYKQRMSGELLIAALDVLHRQSAQK